MSSIIDAPSGAMPNESANRICRAPMVPMSTTTKRPVAVAELGLPTGDQSQQRHPWKSQAVRLQTAEASSQPRP